MSELGPLVECVANFSEGRRADVVEAIAEAIRATPGAHILDHSSDPDHNRSVITFAGRPESVGEAAVAAAGEAVELIDLNTQDGVHPRIGAVDVIPFVPLRQITLIAYGPKTRSAAPQGHPVDAGLCETSELEPASAPETPRIKQEAPKSWTRRRPSAYQPFITDASMAGVSRADQKFPTMAEQKGTTSDAGRENQAQYMGVNEKVAASEQLFNRSKARHFSIFPHPGGFAPEATLSATSEFARTTVRIETTAAQFNSFLTLYSAPVNAASPTANAIEADDNGGGPVLLSKIVRNLNGGNNYVAVVTSFFNGGTGNYTLEIEGNVRSGHQGSGTPEPSTALLAIPALAAIYFRRRK